MKYTGNSTENIIERKTKSYRNNKTAKELSFRYSTYISNTEKYEESDKFSEHVSKVELTTTDNYFDEIISIYCTLQKCEYFTKTRHKIIDDKLILTSRDKKYKKWITEVIELAK